MKKLLYILNEYPSTTETFISNQISLLKQKGYDISIISSRGNKLDRNVIYLPPLNKSKFKLRLISIYLLLNLFVKKPILFYRAVSFFLRHIKSFSYRNLFYISTIAENKFDIIIAHFGWNGQIAAMFKQISPDTKFLTIFHGNDISGYYEEDTSQYDDVLKSSDHIIAISKKWHDKLLRMGCQKEKLSIIHMGVPLDKINTKSDYHFDFPFRILSIGRLTEKKGHIYSIKAIKHVKDKGFNVNLTIIGEGEQKQFLTDLIKELKLENNVFLVGSKENSQILEQLPNFDAFILPSTTSTTGDMEGIPVSLMEAMATGLPVISTFHSGIPELIENDISGSLVEEKNDTAISEKIISLIEDIELRKKMGFNAKKRIKSYFCKEKEIELLILAIKKALL